MKVMTIVGTRPEIMDSSADESRKFPLTINYISTIKKGSL